MNNRDKTPLVIYWSPGGIQRHDNKPSTNLTYPDPKNLYQELSSTKTKDSKNFSFFSCPAVADRFKSTFVFRNNTKTTVHWDAPIDQSYTTTPNVEPYGIHATYPRPAAMENTASLWLSLSWVFFCEEDITAYTQAPYMHKPTFLNQGVIVPGAYNIGSWFRRLPAEMHMWSSSGTITIDEDEPLFYLELATTRPIILKRFTLNQDLIKILDDCTAAPGIFEKHLPLVDRYKRFKETSTNKLVIKEIKKNLVE